MQCLQPLPHGQQLAFFSPHNQELVATYLTYLQARQYATSTVYNTIGTLKRFCERLPAPRRARIVDNFAQLTADDVEAWLQVAHQEGLAPSTINRFLTVLHHFCAFLYAHGQLAQQPIHWRRHHVMVPHPLPKPMAEADLVRFFQVIDALEDRTMFLLMLRCGLRVGEVRALTWPVIDMEQGALRINTSKGQVDRVVYLSPDVAQALRQWQRLQPPSATYVFPSALRPERPVTVRTIQRHMRHYLRVAQIATAYSPHCLRHTFATQLLNAGASLEVVKELMGHRSIQMTLRYTQLYDTTKRQQYDRAMAQLAPRQALLGR